MRLVAGLLAVVGTLLFGAALVLSYVQPTFAESIARELVRREVERRVGATIARLDDSRIVGLAQGMLRANDTERGELERALAEGLPRKVADIAAQMLDADCACRRNIEQSVTRGIGARLVKLARGSDAIDRLVRAKYMEVAAALTREFRIFTAANALAFATLGLVVLVRRRASWHLLPATFVLVGASVGVAALYLFQQDWLHTIVFGDYVGLAYFAYLGLAIALLGDLAFNRGRVTTKLFNAALDVFGSALVALPC